MAGPFTQLSVLINALANVGLYYYMDLLFKPFNR